MRSLEFYQYLLANHACQASLNFAACKSWKTVYETCQRGDWLLWLFTRTNPDDLESLTRAKIECVKPFLHLTDDEVTLQGVETTERFLRGDISLGDLIRGSNHVDKRSYDLLMSKRHAEAHIATAVYSAMMQKIETDHCAAYAVASAAEWNAHKYEKWITKNNTLMLTADICRQYLPYEIWSISNQ